MKFRQLTLNGQFKELGFEKVLLSTELEQLIQSYC